MAETEIENKLKLWVENVTDVELSKQLQEMQKDYAAGNKDAVNDAFFQDLHFGTAGLRGIIGAGTNRMNIHTVGRATQGYANYLNANFEHPSVVIARDPRHNGELFCEVAASILAANGVKVHYYDEIAAVPLLSFTVRKLGATGGICMTASHNPAEYNGYKVYGSDGCQIASEAAAEISAAIEQVDIFTGIKTMPFDDTRNNDQFSYIKRDVPEAYVDAVLEQGLKLHPNRPYGDHFEHPDQFRQSLKVVYAPLYGAGCKPVERIFSKAGFYYLYIPAGHDYPDGDFPDCKSPNPENIDVYEYPAWLGNDVGANIVLATDPDADRVGVMCRRYREDFKLLTGNEVGILLLDYICRCRKNNGENLSEKVAVTTIVSSAMTDCLAQEYGFELRRCLTGFKYIGNIISELANAGEEERFIFGFEESCGYLSGAHVRDKDAPNACLLIAEMAQAYLDQHKSLLDVLDELYNKYGWYFNRTVSVSFPGAQGAETMKEIMDSLHKNPPSEVAGFAVEEVLDYSSGINGLPPADVLELRLANNNKLIVRPSGTEPKIKLYVFACGKSESEANDLLDTLEAAGRELLNA